MTLFICWTSPWISALASRKKYSTIVDLRAECKYYMHV